MWRLRLWPLLAALGWFAFFVVAASAPQQLEHSLAAQAAALICGVCILMALLLSGERPRWPAWSRWVLFALGVAAVTLPYTLNLHAPLARALASLGLVAAALPLGYWIGDRMQRVTNLLPLAVAMSMADIFSVYQGPSHTVSEKITTYHSQLADTLRALGPQATPDAVAQATAAIRAPFEDYIVVHMPVVGTHNTLPVLGIGDFIVLAFLFRAAWVHRLNPRAVFTAGLVSVLLALLISNATSQAIPALPIIAAGTVGYLWVSDARVRKIDRQEAFLSIAVAAFFGSLMLAKWLMAVLR